MKSEKTFLLLVAFIVLAILVGTLVYPSLPDIVASHWNTKGEVDGYTPKFWAIFLIPIFMTGMLVLYLFIPKIDPLKANIESFRKQYNNFFITLFGFFLYIFFLILFWNLCDCTYEASFAKFLIPAIATLWYFIGALLQKSKRNWFIGIRTPWTLSSDEVWEKTHKLGGVLFKLAAVFALIGLFISNNQIIFITIIIPVMIIVLVTVIYSYLAYQKTKTNY